MFASARASIAAGSVLLALVLLPAPLLPPLGFAGTVQSWLGIGSKAAFLVATLALQGILYGSLGIVSAFAVGPGTNRREQWLRFATVPVAVVGAALLVRSLKLGHVPVLANAVVPMAACLLGVVTGLLLRQHGWRITLLAGAGLVAGLLWAYWPGVGSALSRATHAQLRRVVEAAPMLPAGEERFGALLQAAFSPAPATNPQPAAVERNRAAILALGIAIGHERLARCVGLTPKHELVRAAMGSRAGTTLRGREDWARHFCLSAALAIVETPFLGDTGGLIKEELDSLALGSGFSFGDLAADRAGIRFAEAATASESAALAMQARLRNGFVAVDFFPPTAGLPENLSVEEFRREYGGVGSPRYRQTVAEIEARLNRCPALVFP